MAATHLRHLARLEKFLRGMDENAADLQGEVGTTCPGPWAPSFLLFFGGSVACFWGLAPVCLFFEDRYISFVWWVVKGHDKGKPHLFPYFLVSGLARVPFWCLASNDPSFPLVTGGQGQ